MTESRQPAREPRLGVEGRRAGAVGAAGVALVVIALAFDAAPLFVPAFALMLIGAAAPLWVWSNARGARVRRRLPAERVVEREPLQASIEVRRGPFGRAGWSRFEVLDPLTGSRLRLGGELAPARGDRTLALRVTARFERRGEQHLPAPILLARDPLDLARARTVSTQSEQTLLVLPRTEPVHWLGARRGRRLVAAEGDASTEAMAATDLEGLRPYRPGTPASRIHWPAVARGRGLIERRLQADGDTRPLVVLDARQPAGAGPEPLDAAVRAAASLTLHLAHRGGCSLLLPGEQRPVTVDAELLGWPAVYARLAVVGTDPAHRPRRAPSMAGAMHRSGTVLYVAATANERLVAALSGATGSVLLVVPSAELIDGRPRGVGNRATPALTVSGCQGFALGARGHRRATAATAGTGAGR